VNAGGTQDRRFSVKLAEDSMKNDEMSLKAYYFYLNHSVMIYAAVCSKDE
jgi:hypothetical protein